MTNSYFTWDNPIGRLTLALSARINALGAALEAAFDMLPAPTTIWTGTVTYGVDSGAADAYAITLPGVTAYVDGLRVVVKIANANTGASSLNVSGLGARAIKKPDGTDLLPADLVAGSIHEFSYSTTSSQFTIQTVTQADLAEAAASAAAAAASASAAAASAAAAAAAAAALADMLADDLVITGNWTFADGAELRFGGGTGGDFVIVHDGTNTALWQKSGGDLRLRSAQVKFAGNTDNELIFTGTEGGACIFYNDAIEAVRTTGSPRGILVTGKVSLLNDTEGEPAPLTDGARLWAVNSSAVLRAINEAGVVVTLV